MTRNRLTRGLGVLLAAGTLAVTGAAPASAASLKLPPPGVWYAQEGVQCASMNVPKGGREGIVHQWVWKKRAVNGKTQLHCEYGGSWRVRS